MVTVACCFVMVVVLVLIYEKIKKLKN